MVLYVVRHGQTDWNAKGNIQGNTDVALNAIGKKQAERIRSEVEGISFDICYSSPLSRAFETSSIICDGKTEIVTDDRLIERELGELEGRPFVEYNTKLYWNYDLNSTANGVEGIQDLFERVKSFYNDLIQKHENETVLVVAHGAIIRALHHVIVGYDSTTNFLDFDVPNCHVFKYDI